MRRGVCEVHQVIAGDVEGSLIVVKTHGASRDADSLTYDVRGAHQLGDSVAPHCHTCHTIFVGHQHVHAGRWPSLR